MWPQKGQQGCTYTQIPVHIPLHNPSCIVCTGKKVLKGSKLIQTLTLIVTLKGSLLSYTFPLSKLQLSISKPFKTKALWRNTEFLLILFVCLLFVWLFIRTEKLFQLVFHTFLFKSSIQLSTPSRSCLENFQQNGSSLRSLWAAGSRGSKGKHLKILNESSHEHFRLT